MQQIDYKALSVALIGGQRRALAKGITLVESTCAEHRHLAQLLLTELMPKTGRSVRLGISGSPGAGKSSTIEVLGLWLVEQGYKVAVLAVDPSSSVSGGSILGDKTRMELLSRHPAAFIRPSPSAGSLGGVAAKTREAMLLCEAAGFDVIIVETVGVGQSETRVAGMVDCFCLLQLPNAGDDLQAIKKGIVELADIILINKADIDKNAANLTAKQWKNALHLLRPALVGWQVPVLPISARTEQGIAEFWQHLQEFKQLAESTDAWHKKRQQQSLEWMWTIIDIEIYRSFRQNPEVIKKLAQLTEQVADGVCPPTRAAQMLLSAAGIVC